MNNAGGLHWPELEGPTDIVLIVVEDWYITHAFQTPKPQMTLGYWSTRVQTVRKTLKSQKCFQYVGTR